MLNSWLRLSFCNWNSTFWPITSKLTTAAEFEDHLLKHLIYCLIVPQKKLFLFLFHVGRPWIKVSQFCRIREMPRVSLTRLKSLWGPICGWEFVLNSLLNKHACLALEICQMPSDFKKSTTTLPLCSSSTCDTPWWVRRWLLESSNMFLDWTQKPSVASKFMAPVQQASLCRQNV